MKEKIIVAPSVNGTELLRFMARNGKNTLGYRVMNGTELAEFALMKAGIFTDLKYIRTNEAAALIYGFLNEIGLFSSASFSDAENIASTLREVRMLIPENENEIMHEKLENGKFPDNTAALLDVYDRYIEELKKLGFFDDIQLMRKAAEVGCVTDAELITLKEHPLSPLECRLVSGISDGKYSEISICGLLGIGKNSVSYTDITEAYGASNEVQNIIANICKSGRKLDECTVAVADISLYTQLFYEMSQRCGIPMSFGCGLPITNTTPAALLNNYLQWEKSGFHGKDALEKMLFSDSFERSLLLEKLAIDNKQLKDIISLAGNLKLSTERSSNVEKLKNLAKTDSVTADEISLLKLLAEEFERGCSYFIKTYAHIRKSESGKLDRSSVNVICNDLDAFSLVEDADVCEIIPSILSKTICSENSREGCLHIIGIGQALESLRDELYICGLSADVFPGRAKENYLLTDANFMLFCDDPPTSENNIKRKVTMFEHLLKTASSIGNAVHLSYSGFDSAELKAVNPSSVLFEAFRVKNGEESTLEDMKKTISHVGYFSSGFSAADNIAKAYSKGRRICIKPVSQPDIEREYKNDRAFSVSAVENYMKCPGIFYYGSILRLREKDADDPLTVIDAREKGTLFHTLMEINANDRMSKEEILEKAGELWDDYMTKRPPVNKNHASELRQEFLDMAVNGWLSDIDNEVIHCEYGMEFVHPSGIKIIGKADRVEKSSDNAITVADFKTGKSEGYEENDINSCIQTLLYAYMLSKQGINAENCEYRFVKENRKVKCTYSDIFEAEIDMILEKIADSIKQNSFERIYDRNKCMYCGYAGICPKEVAE